MVLDEDKNPAIFPTEIVVTAERPDVTIYSNRERKCVVIELTVPSEEIFATASSRKKCKYVELIQDCHDAGWKTQYFAVEVGSRGFTNVTTRSCLTYMGHSNKDIRMGCT
ncbi:uncharacterized protein [Ptychodera flava]|uniref:uncharacterized protein n=1 Tax=Ptychodera flava TaxID=63121 RepID=UPI00396A2D33